MSTRQPRLTGAHSLLNINWHFWTCWKVIAENFPKLSFNWKQDRCNKYFLKFPRRHTWQWPKRAIKVSSPYFCDRNRDILRATTLDRLFCLITTWFLLSDCICKDYTKHMLYFLRSWMAEELLSSTEHPSGLFKKTPFKDPVFVSRSAEQLIGSNRAPPSDAASKSCECVSLQRLAAKLSARQSNAGVVRWKSRLREAQLFLPAIKSCWQLKPGTTVRQLCSSCAFPIRCSSRTDRKSWKKLKTWWWKNMFFP